MTKDSIQKLAMQARRGDSDALSHMKQEIKTLSKRANQRMLELERHGFDRYSYDRAIAFTTGEYGTNRFASKTKGVDIDDLEVELRELTNFLNNPTSTLRGAKQFEETRGEQLLTKWGIEFDNAVDRGNFFKLLGTSEIQQFIRDVPVKYQTIVDAMATTIKESDNKAEAVDMIQRKVNQYLSGGLMYDELEKQLGV